jgi:hypothetical protein
VVGLAKTNNVRGQTPGRSSAPVAEARAEVDASGPADHETPETTTTGDETMMTTMTAKGTRFRCDVTDKGMRKLAEKYLTDIATGVQKTGGDYVAVTGRGATRCVSEYRARAIAAASGGTAWRLERVGGLDARGRMLTAYTRV